MTHPTVSLGQLAEITSGFAFKSELFNTSGEGLPLVRIRDVVDGKSDTYYSGEYKPEFIVEMNDALIGMDGQFNLARWRGGKALLNQRVCKVKVIDDRLDQNYLLRFLPSVLKDIEDKTPFVTVKHLSVKTLREIEIPLVPISEQRRIASILDKADALRAKRREAIAKLDQLLQSVFLEMFGDPVINSKGWPQIPFEELLENIDSGKSPVCLERPVVDGEWGVLKLGAVTRCIFDPAENKALPPGTAYDPNLEVKKGDLLFTRKNTYDLVAACAYVSETPPPRLLLPDLIFRFRLKPDAPLSARYLQSLLTHPGKRKSIQSLAGGAAGSMPNISKAKLKTVLIELPPQALQEQYEKAVKSIEAIKSNQLVSLGKMDAAFMSLQQSLFQGNCAT